MSAPVPTAPATPETRSSRSPLMILAVTLLIDLLGFGMILPLLPVYITHYGGKPWVGGVLLAGFSVTQFIFSPIWGRVSDQRGRRPMILLSLIGSSISFLAFGLAPNLVILFLARIAAGILSAASLPTAQSYIADVTPPDKRASGMAVLGAAFGIGFALGPAIGGFLSRYQVFGLPSLATPSLFAALLSLVNFIWAYFMLPESLKKEDRAVKRRESALDVFPGIARALRNPDIGSQLTVFAFTTFAFTAVESSFSWLVLLRFRDVLKRGAIQAWQTAHPEALFTSLSPAHQQELVEKAQTAANSRVFLIVGVTVLITQIAVIGGVARKVGENRMVIIGSLLLTLSLLGIALAPTLLLINLLAVGIAVGNGFMNSSLSALITQSAKPQERGALSGTQQGLGSLARMIAPPINNTLVQTNPAIPFFGSAIIMGVAFLLSLRLKPLQGAPDPAHPGASTPPFPSGAQTVPSPSGAENAPRNGHAAPESETPTAPASRKPGL